MWKLAALPPPISSQISYKSNNSFIKIMAKRVKFRTTVRRLLPAELSTYGKCNYILEYCGYNIIG